MSGAVRFSVSVQGKPTPAHTTTRLFVNGASAGLLTMRNDERLAFSEWISNRDEICEILDALAYDPGAASTRDLAHRAARLLGLPCQVGSCSSCQHEIDEARAEPPA